MIGTLVRDRIWHPTRYGNDPVEQWGGIAYALTAFSAARSSDWVVVPIVRIGSDLAGPALEFLGSLPGLEVGAGVAVVPEPNNRVELRYVDGAHRKEALTGGVSTWTRPEIEPLLADLDALYVNFISGFEIDLETAEGFRGLPIPTYSDLHSLFLGPPLIGPRGAEARIPCRPADWRRWVSAFDAVQLNEAEMALLSMAGLEEDARFEALPALGPALAIVTRGGLGADCAYDEAAGTVFHWPARREPRAAGDPAAVRVARVGLAGGEAQGDPTGCGDVWGSVAFMSLLQGLDIEPAMERANAAAAARLGVGRIEDLREALATTLSSGVAAG